MESSQTEIVWNFRQRAGSRNFKVRQGSCSITESIQSYCVESRSCRNMKDLSSLRPLLGGTGTPYPAESAAVREMPSDRILIAVAGAHLSGEPLNHQLTDRGARLVRKTKTAPSYQLFALPGTSPPKPGLVRVGCETGRSIDVEVWDMPLSGFGGFIDEIPPPLTIGTVHLSDGRVAKGFLCEEIAVRDALNISEFGGWKAYLKSLTISAEWKGSGATVFVPPGF